MKNRNDKVTNAYVSELDKRIERLKPFSNLDARTQAYVAPIPYIADLSITLYSALANGIDQDKVRFHEMQIDSFEKTRTFVDRSILVQFVSVIESLFHSYCKNHKLEVTSVEVRRATNIIKQCDDRLDSKSRKWLQGKLNSHPLFEDYSKCS